ASAGANTVFTFSLDGTSGAWTFTLVGQLDHAAGNNENDLTINLSSILRATDFDQDTVAAAPNALIITVDDDTPTASQASSTGTVDEDGLPGGIPGGVGDVPGEAITATGSVAPLFTSGADQPLTFSLSTDNRGLPQTLTSGGVAVTYSVSGNTLTAKAGVGGPTVFTFALDGTSGAWTFTLVGQLDHAAGNNENDLTINLSSILRATDFDQDTVAAAPNALIITVDDDTPTASQASSTGTVDEDGLPGGIPGGVGDVPGEAITATGSVAPLFTSGADQPLTFSLSTDNRGLPQTLTSGGVAVTYSVSGNTLTAKAGVGGPTVFTFALDGTSGAWTFTLVGQLDHAAGNNENDLTINLSSILRATDFDQDTVAAAPNALIITVDDDTPTASQASSTGTVDEDGLPGGIPGGVGDVPGEAITATGSVAPLFTSGADQPLTFSLSTDNRGLPQTLTSGGVAVTYSVSGNTLTAKAGVGGPTVFTFALDGTSGAWTFTLVGQLDHAAGNNENDLTINLSSILRATDFDQDTVAAAPNALIITVDDDTPTASQASSTGTVDEDGLPGGIPGGVGDVPGEAITATGSVAPLFNSGADQPLTFSLSTDTSGLPQTLTSGGVAVTYSVSGNTLTAKAGVGGPTVVTFSLDGTSGAWTFTLVGQLDHAAGNNENDLTINLSSILRATDFDQDTVAAAPNALIITVDDDTPTASQASSTGTVDEDGLPGGIPGGVGDVAGEATVATGSVAPL